jgi:predicted transcriptional regulator
MNEKIRPGSVFESILKRCEKIGITMSTLSKASGVPISTIYWWRDKEPPTLIKYKKIIAALDMLEKQETDVK